MPTRSLTLRLLFTHALCLALIAAIGTSGCNPPLSQSRLSPEFIDGQILMPRHHRVDVTIDETAHRLVAEDRIVFHPNGTHQSTIAFYLHPQLEIDEIILNGTALAVQRQPPNLPQDPFSRQRYAGIDQLTRYEAILPAVRPDQPVTMTVRYHGPMAAQAAGASKFGGHINPTELFLPGESAWYPVWPLALFTFDLHIDHPAAWVAVSAGQLTSEETRAARTRTSWSMTQTTDSIDVIAAPYEVTTRSRHGLTISTYFFHEDAGYADEYLDAATAYLDRYSRLLGPYPYSKFALVETSFPIGAAFPSFTLLGQQIVKRHYTQPYALGHEIVHAWMGNSVMADMAQGNWAEALTTYLSNYYVVEVDQGELAAQQERWNMLVQYATLVREEQDYPLMRFLANNGPLDSAIGYQKGAFVFHLLRQMMGDEEFFAGLRELTRRYQGQRAGWNDLRLIFEARLHQPLDWFFRQWVVRAGAPQLAIDRVELTTLPPEAGLPQGSRVQLHLRQSSPPFRFPITVHIETNDRILEKTFWMSEVTTTIETVLGSPPLRIAVDPFHHLFRRLSERELAPMLNLSLASRSMQVVLPDQADDASAGLYQQIADRATKRHHTLTAGLAPAGMPPDEDASTLLLGSPAENRSVAELATRLPAGMAIDATSFTINKQRYDLPAHALLLTFRDPAHHHRLNSLFYGLSSDAIKPLPHLLLYHGWDSYVVFLNGRAITNGRLPATQPSLTWEPPQPSPEPPS